MSAPRHRKERSLLEDLRRAPAILKGTFRSKRRMVLLVISVVLFLVVLSNMLAGDLLRLDYMAYKVFVVRMRRAWLTPIMQSISELALPVVLLVMLLAVRIFAPGKRPGLFAAINLVGVVLVNQVFKFMVQRPRPEGFRIIAEGGYSFPSGHSMVAMGFYGLLAWMAWHYEKDPVVRRVSVCGFALIVALVGISRVYLGVHYASDVIAGFCLSLAWLALYTTFMGPVFLPEDDTRLDSDHTGEMDKIEA